MEEQINRIYSYLHSLWKYRWSALMISWIVALIGWLAVYALPNKYEAKAVVYIDTETVMKPLLKGLAIDTEAASEVKIISRVLLSRKNLQYVIRETDMDLQAQTTKEKEALIAHLAKTIVLKGDDNRDDPWAPKTNLYEIEYTSTSAERAYKVVSILLNKLIENALSSGTKDTQHAQDFLDGQIKDHEKLLNKAEAKLAAFKKKHAGLMPDEKGSFNTRLQRSQELVEKTQSNLRLEKSRYTELRNQLRSETPTLGGEGQASAAKLREYHDQLSELLTRFTEQHPDVVALQSKIADLKQSTADGTDVVFIAGEKQTFNPVYKELKVQESKARIEISSLKIQLAEQKKKVALLKKSIDSIPEIEAELPKLTRDYDIIKERYESLVKRRAAASLSQQASENSSGTFKVIEPPRLPVLPAAPNRPLLLAGVFLAALGAGLGWCALRYLLHPAFADYKQVKDRFGLPVLGAVSLFRGPERIKQRRVQLVGFLVSILLLAGGLGGVLYLQEPGSKLVRSLMTESGIHI